MSVRPATPPAATISGKPISASRLACMYSSARLTVAWRDRSFDPLQPFAVVVQLMEQPCAAHEFSERSRRYRLRQDRIWLLHFRNSKMREVCEAATRALPRFQRRRELERALQRLAKQRGKLLAK